MTNPKNPAPQQNAAPKAPYDNWEDEQTGFPPYYQPDEGNGFVARVIDIDDSGDFRRYVLEAVEPIADGCFRGSNDRREPVPVAKGEQFSCSHYSNLPLDKYLGIVIKATCKEEIKISGGKTLWLFRIQVSPEDKARLLQLRTEQAKTRSALPASTPKSDADPPPFG